MPTCRYVWEFVPTQGTCHSPGQICQLNQTGEWQGVEFLYNIGSVKGLERFSESLSRKDQIPKLGLEYSTDDSKMFQKVLTTWDQYLVTWKITSQEYFSDSCFKEGKAFGNVFQNVQKVF